MTQRIEESACPKCGLKLDAVTPVHGWEPVQPGDLSVCVQCAAVVRFDHTLHVHAVRVGEFKWLPHDVRRVIENTQQAIRAANAIRKATN